MSTEAPGDVEQTRSRATRSGLLTPVLVGVGLAVVAAASYWWTHATVFSGLGDAVRMDPRTVAQGATSSTVIFPKLDGDPETITIKGLDAHFSTNTARARASFSICHMGPRDDVIGAVHDAHTACHDIVPAATGSAFRLAVAPHSDYLFVTVTPTAPGSAHMVSVDIDYRRGGSHLFQRGSQSIRVDRTITVY